MALAPISAVDAVAPAFDRMRQILFGPFRLGLWLRLFVVGLLTGELSSGGMGSLFNIPAQVMRTGMGRGRGLHFSPIGLGLAGKYLPLIAVLVLIAVVIVLMVMYLGAVLRFVLLEAVIRGQFRLRSSFSRWRRLAGTFFVLQLWLTLVAWGLMLAIVAGPGLKAWRAGFGAATLRAMLVEIVLAVLLLILVSVAFGVVWMFIKDFTIPLMAIEELRVGQACQRLWQMLRAWPGAFAGYFGMKIVLMLAAGAAAAVVILVLVVFLLLPGVLLIVGGLAGGGAVGARALAFAGAIALFLLFGLLALVAGVMIAVARMVFMQAYRVRFLAGRYEPLAAILFPQPMNPEEPEPAG